MVKNKQSHTNDSFVSLKVDRLRQTLLRSDLPATRRHRMMQLKQTPVGNGFLETEKLFLSLQQRLQLHYFALAEQCWVLNPPVGPRPKASWSAPSFDLETDKPTTLYIVTIDVPYSDGIVRRVFKPGVTQRSIYGKQGRYPRKPFVSLLYENKSLLPAVAWASEQKLLASMPRLTSAYTCLGETTFHSTMRMLDEIEDATLVRCPSAIFSEPETYSIPGSQQIEMRDLLRNQREDRRARLPRPDWLELGGRISSWGPTEWRHWPVDDTADLIEYAEEIVASSFEYTELLP